MAKSVLCHCSAVSSHMKQTSLIQSLYPAVAKKKQKQKKTNNNILITLCSCVSPLGLLSMDS